jgi:hypothetical protein
VAEQPGAYTLAAWVRQGISAAPLPPETLSANLAARVPLPIELRVGADPVNLQARMLGPGDVVGIDQRQVVRTDPRPRSSNVEPNYLAIVEFDRPDFPWLFTPAAADAQNRLRPWLCLIVVRRQDGVTIFMDPARPLPTLTIGEPALVGPELPNLTESYAWAHGQVVGTTSIFDAQSELTRSRLLCPRRLQPNTAYIACVVPTFLVGRQAGLGQSVTAADLTSLQPAWTGQETTIQLPVYYQWEFSTGQVGDFQSLVEKIKVRQLPATVGIRPMSVANADPDLPVIPATSPDAVLGLEGALMSVATQPRGFSDGFGLAFRAALRTRLTPPPTGTTDPIVTPPIYGARHVNLSAVPADTAPPHWLRELNLDPRYRAVAALGTSVIQAEQEQLMAAAWEQVGEMQRANQLLRQAQMLRAANQSVYSRRLQRLPDGVLLQVTRAIHGRVLETTSPTTFQFRMTTTLASGPVAPAFRRISRPRGPVARRVLAPQQRVVRPILQKIGDGVIANFLAPPTPGPTFVAAPGAGITTFDAVEARFRAFGGTRDPNVEISASQMARLTVANIPQRPLFRIVPPELPGFPVLGPPGLILRTDDSPEAVRFRAAVIAHQALIVPGIGTAFFRLPPQVGQIRADLMARIEPNATSAARVGSLVTYAGPRDARDALEPIMAAPQFPTPMYEPLRDLSRDLLVPGLDVVEDNSVAPLQTNPRFIEAYMVGLNHEFARELLWREYPTDQRGTYFRQFWDSRGQPAPTPDIPPIHTWLPARHLSQNVNAGGVGQLVLLMRAELLRRYPNAIIYAVRATLPAGQTRPRPGTQEMYPLFRGDLQPDLVFFGFGLSAAQARGDGTDPGWFFMIQQQPSEPRFGLDVGAASPDPNYLHPTGDAAATARPLLQRPVRVAIHASALLP